MPPWIHFKRYASVIAASPAPLLPAGPDKIPGIAGGIDVGEGQSLYTQGHGRLHQLLRSVGPIPEAEICFAVQIHMLLQNPNNFSFFKTKIIGEA